MSLSQHGVPALLPYLQEASPSPFIIAKKAGDCVRSTAGICHREEGEARRAPGAACGRKGRRRAQGKGQGGGPKGGRLLAPRDRQTALFFASAPPALPAAFLCCDFILHYKFWLISVYKRNAHACTGLFISVWMINFSRHWMCHFSYCKEHVFCLRLLLVLLILFLLLVLPIRILLPPPLPVLSSCRFS